MLTEKLYLFSFFVFTFLICHWNTIFVWGGKNGDLCYFYRENGTVFDPCARESVLKALLCNLSK